MNLYVMLGVGRQATLDEVRRAYRRLARKYHPDVNPGDHEAADVYRRVSLAYETLSDPERRRLYDAQGEVADPSPGPAATFEFQGFDFSVTADRGPASTFLELFGDAVLERAGAARRGAPEPGAALHAAVEIGFEEAVRGTPVTLTLTRLERCAPCAGLGRLSGPEVRCPQCDGAGSVRATRGHMIFSRTCPACGGAAVLRYRTCPACGGDGVGVHAGPVRLPLPPGVENGAELVMPGEGHAGRRGGAAGALHLTVTVRPHRHFRRVGYDVHLDVPVAVHEAGLGARIDVPAVDGRIRLRVPPGTQSGQTFRFRERGVPRPDGTRGDFLVTTHLVLPALLDQRSRELLREFALHNPEDVRAGWAAAAPPCRPELHAATPAPPDEGPPSAGEQER
jgi:molecular chaperone DnaJ